MKTIDQRKKELLNKVKPLTEQKKRLYGHLDISLPKSENEKQLEKEIASIYSEINQLIRIKNKRKSKLPTHAKAMGWALNLTTNAKSKT